VKEFIRHPNRDSRRHGFNNSVLTVLIGHIGKHPARLVDHRIACVELSLGVGREIFSAARRTAAPLGT
jgi:hypothetical protein